MAASNSGRSLEITCKGSNSSDLCATKLAPPDDDSPPPPTQPPHNNTITSLCKQLKSTNVKNKYDNPKPPVAPPSKEDPRVLKKKSITCRFCKGPHFSFRCPNRKPLKVELPPAEDDPVTDPDPPAKSTKSMKTRRRDKSKHSIKNFKHKSRIGGGKAGYLIQFPCLRVLWSVISFATADYLSTGWNDYDREENYATALDRNDPNYDSEEEGENLVVTRTSSMVNMDQLFVRTNQPTNHPTHQQTNKQANKQAKQIHI